MHAVVMLWVEVVRSMGHAAGVPQGTGSFSGAASRRHQHTAESVCIRSFRHHSFAASKDATPAALSASAPVLSVDPVAM